MPSPLVAPRAMVRHRSGHRSQLNVAPWLAEADDVDLRLLQRACGPVLDVGCGPGRHVEALSLQATDVLGIDLSPEFVSLAQERQRPVLLQSVFAPMPREREWQCALILDGSIGIGGNPTALLHRIATLLAPCGRALVEVALPDEPSEELIMEIEMDDGCNATFEWASLSASDMYAVAHASQFTLSDVWEDSGRWFAQLDLPVS
jgi:SAM-dependent methyltransferase